MPVLSLLALLLISQVSDPAADLDSGRKALAENDTRTAIFYFDRAARMFPTWGLAHLELAEALLRESPDASGLASALSAARSLEPHNPRVWRVTGLWHEQKEETVAALEAYARAVELRPEVADSRERLGLLLLREGRAAEALPHLLEAVRARAGDFALRANLAEAHEQVGDVKGAEAELKGITEAAPENSVYRRRLAAFYERTGQQKRADEEFRKLDAQRPQRKLRPLPASKR